MHQNRKLGTSRQGEHCSADFRQAHPMNMFSLPPSYHVELLNEHVSEAGDKGGHCSAADC